jgi:hypothetical protein
VPNLEPRLQRRYDQLVQEHVAPLQAVAAGLRAAPSTLTAFASTQAAWRFCANPRATLPILAQPLLDLARQAVPIDCLDYALVVLDWSQLHYSKHTGKRDRIELTNFHDLGYELLTALLLSDQTGRPIAPICQDLRAADGLHSTRFPTVHGPVTKLDRLGPVMQYVNAQCLGKPAVFIIDREADSVAHYRRWSRQGHLFLVRADDTRLVQHAGQKRLLPEVVDNLQQRGMFRDTREILYHGTKARRLVAETDVILTQPAKSKHGRVTTPGPALTLRLVVVHVRNTAGELLAQWLLLSNVPKEITTERLASWYYWRWLVETYFKLLKGAGLQLENWQQETASALAKRLAVAAMACVLVWKVARDSSAEGQKLRALLARMSGRQINRADGFTEPALLAGLYVLLNTLEIIEHCDPQELRRLLNTVLKPALEPPPRRRKKPTPPGTPIAEALV